MKAWLLMGLFFAALSASLLSNADTRDGDDEEPDTRTIHVNSIATLQLAIDRARAGDTIILENGKYTTSEFIQVVRRNGTQQKPIIIRAQSILGVEIHGTHGFSLRSSNHVTIKGFKFKHERGHNIIQNGLFNRYTRNYFDGYGVGDDVTVRGSNSEVSYNKFTWTSSGLAREGGEMVHILETAGLKAATDVKVFR
ncbi:MAG: chondroitinase-B domain-containing protein, partial [Pseudomonadota bacterium]